MNRVGNFAILCLFLSTSCFAKLEALSVMTKYCGKAQLLQAGKGAIHKVVSEFNGNDMRGFIIELDLKKLSKTDLIKNLMSMGCYTQKSSTEEVLERVSQSQLKNRRHAALDDDESEYLMPEDFFTDDALDEELFLCNN